MEQLKPHQHQSNKYCFNHYRLDVRLGFVAILFCVVGCKQPVSNPEAIDPIYSDLKSEATKASQAAETEKATIEELVMTIQKMEPRDPGKNRAIREKYQREAQLVQLQQMARYFEIRAEQRKAFDQKDYLEAFKAQKPWPKPGEFEEYKNRKRLQSVSRNWDDRVPKLTRHMPASTETSEKKPEKPKAAH